MFEKPRLDDAKILAHLWENYGLMVTDIEFLPLGHDAYAGVYRVSADDGRDYFLKVKQGTVHPVGAEVARWLADQGIRQVVAPLPTVTGKVSGVLEEFVLLLYPFIEGRDGLDAGLSDAQWVEYGAVLNAIHAVQLPPDLARRIPAEVFRPTPSGLLPARRLQAEIPVSTYDAPFEQQLAALWRTHHHAIGTLIDRLEALGQRLEREQLERESHAFVLCHADIHTANLLLTPDGVLYVVDWDQPQIAPRERDLIFAIASSSGIFAVTPHQKGLFFEGYGDYGIDPLAMAYYRLDWLVQDIGEFGKSVFYMPDAGAETKQDALDIMSALFVPGGQVEQALNQETP